MKRKVLSVMLVAAMTASLFAGCGSSSSDSESSNSGSSAGASGTEAEETQAADSGDEEESEFTATAPSEDEIVIWVAQNMVDLTKEYAESFLSENGYDFSVRVEAVGEGDAASNVITDVESAADIYTFAQDQMARLISAGGLQPLQTEYAEWAAENHATNAVAAATSGDYMYAFPITADNGYFLYYDSSVITDPTSLEQIVADCEAAGKNFYYAFTSWYEESFFFATGCTIEYTVATDGSFTEANIDMANDQGVVALNEMIELASSSCYQSGSDANSAVDYAAIIDGTWDSSTIKAALGDNFACAELPSFVGSDGETYHLSGFSGYKLIGIKPQTEATKLEACYALAEYLSDYEVSMARFEAEGWGPSNLEAQQDEAVQSDIALAAMASQDNYNVVQGQYSTNYWSIMDTLGSDAANGTSGVEDCLSYLTDIQEKLIADIE